MPGIEGGMDLLLQLTSIILIQELSAGFKRTMAAKPTIHNLTLSLMPISARTTIPLLSHLIESQAFF